jgi:hypothetical protein
MLNGNDLPPLLHGHYPASSLLQGSPPLSSASVLSASRLEPLAPFPLASPARLPGRRGRYHPRPPQTRTCAIHAFGSSRESFADDVMDAFGAVLCHRHSLTEGAYLVSLAIHVVSWTRFAGCMSRPLFLDMVLSSRRLPSLLRVPASLVPRSRRYYEGATTSHLRISGRLFCSLPPPT